MVSHLHILEIYIAYLYMCNWKEASLCLMGLTSQVAVCWIPATIWIWINDHQFVLYTFIFNLLRNSWAEIKIYVKLFSVLSLIIFCSAVQGESQSVLFLYFFKGVRTVLCLDCKKMKPSLKMGCQNSVMVTPAPSLGKKP